MFSDRQPRTIRRRAIPILILALLAIGSLFSRPSPGGAQGVCGDTYVVLPGDTLSEIADKCGTTVQDILAINPSIENPQDIFVGQVISIPPPLEIVPPTVAISPVCGPPGSTLSLLSSGYPANTSVAIMAGPKGQAASTIAHITSDSFGRIDTAIGISTSAVTQQAWLITTEAKSGSATFKGVSTDFWVTVPAPNPNAAFTYTVQTGDTLAGIAVKVNRTVPALQSANPGITFSTPLIPGQAIRVPAQTASTPVTMLSPACGPAGAQLQVTGNGFPAAMMVNLSLGPYLGDYLPAGSALANTNGTFTAPISFSQTAAVGQNWAVVARTASTPVVSSMSNLYPVTPPVNSNAPQIHFVQAGETLTEIAIAYQRTIDSILRVNSQITNPNRLSPGQKILIPALEESVIISPTSGPAFTALEVLGFAFPPNATVEVGIGKTGAKYQFVRVITTTSSGNLRTQATIPGEARSGEIWKVAVSYGLPNGTLKTVTSNEFRVAPVRPPVQPVVTIWPLSGPPETLLSIVGNNFPPLTAISLELVAEGSEPIPIANVWADINGSFPADMLIPAEVESGVVLAVLATVTSDANITATSEPFTVISVVGSQP